MAITTGLGATRLRPASGRRAHVRPLAALHGRPLPRQDPRQDVDPRPDLRVQRVDLARLETGALRLTVHRIDLVGLLEGLALAFVPAAERRRADVTGTPTYVYDPATDTLVDEFGGCWYRSGRPEICAMCAH